MGKTSYGPRTLRAWREDDKRRTLARVGAALGCTGANVRLYAEGRTVPPERVRSLIALLCGDTEIALERAWKSEREIERRMKQEREDVKRVLAARAEMGGAA